MMKTMEIPRSISKEKRDRVMLILENTAFGKVVNIKMKNFDKCIKYFYPVTISKLSKSDGGGYLAEIYDLPGCISDGRTIDEVLQNIEDAKRAWILVALKRGQSIPFPEMEN